MVHSRAERVFILEHYLASKSFAAIREAFSNGFPDKEVPNKATVHRLEVKFRDTGSVYL
jgi:Holliday junction resolvase